jgi:hypothetical protein
MQTKTNYPDSSRLTIRLTAEQKQAYHHNQSENIALIRKLLDEQFKELAA